MCIHVIGPGCLFRRLYLPIQYPDFPIHFFISISHIMPQAIPHTMDIPTMTCSDRWYTLSRSIRDIKLTLFALVYFTLCLFIAAMANSIADRLNPNNFVPVSERRVLTDPLMQATRPVFKQSGLPDNISDIVLVIALGLALVRIFTLGSMSLTVLRRVFFITGTAYILRSVTVTVTVLPNPLTECQSHQNPNLFLDTLEIFFMRRVSCGDVFFSGHTIMFTVAAAVWITYTANVLMNCFAVLLSAFGAFSLIFSAYHYTIDVFAAVWVVSWLWSSYHLVVKVHGLRSLSVWTRVLNCLDNSEYFKKEDRSLDTGGYFEVISMDTF